MSLETRKSGLLAPTSDLEYRKEVKDQLEKGDSCGQALTGLAESPSALCQNCDKTQGGFSSESCRSDESRFPRLLISGTLPYGLHGAFGASEDSS